METIEQKRNILETVFEGKAIEHYMDHPLSRKTGTKFHAHFDECDAIVELWYDKIRNRGAKMSFTWFYADGTMWYRPCTTLEK